MGNTEDLQQPEQNTYPDSNAASDASGTHSSAGGQSGGGTDWEARFKGLQREFNNLKQTVQGKDSYNTRITREKQELEAQLNQLSTQYEGQLSGLQAQIESLSNERQTYEQRLEQAQAELAQRQTRDNIRRELTQSHQDVLPWFESGYLQIPEGEDGNPLSGEDLSTYINGFKELLGQRSKEDFQSALSGSTPPQFTQGSKAPSGMTVQQMDAWLNDPVNIDNPDRQRVMDSYLEELAKTSTPAPTTLGWS